MDIVGHQAEWARLERMRRSERMPQSLVFVGPPDIGKFLVASEWAKKVAATEDVVVQPDIIVVEPVRETRKGVTREKDIPVGRIREALGELAYLPSGDGRRTLIIRDAHRLTEKAQNALLKTLEEPAAHAVIILVTHSLGRMLPTILSRCQVVTFASVSEMEMTEGGLVTSGLPGELVLLGRPGLCVRYREDPERFARDMELLASLSRIGELSASERLALSETLALDSERLVRLSDWWVALLRRRAQDAASQELFRVVDRIGEAMRASNERHGSARLLLDTLFLSL